MERTSYPAPVIPTIGRKKAKIRRMGQCEFKSPWNCETIKKIEDAKIAAMRKKYFRVLQRTLSLCGSAGKDYTATPR